MVFKSVNTQVLSGCIFWKVLRKLWFGIRITAYWNNLRKDWSRLVRDLKEYVHWAIAFPDLKYPSLSFLKCWLFWVLCKCPDKKSFMFHRIITLKLNKRHGISAVQCLLQGPILASCNYYFLFSLIIHLQSCLSMT